MTIDPKTTLRDAHVSTELLHEADLFLQRKNFSNTRTLRKKLNISGCRAGAVFRRLGWLPYASTRNNRTYQRQEIKNVRR